MSDDLKKVIYEACLASAKLLGPDRIKQMSWFGKNHK
jgi:hypothetical protein